ncbi:MAG: acyltransferase family protein [Mycoplasmoidaceae bacterium]
MNKFKITTTNSRNYFIDFLKTLAIIFVIVVNCSMVFAEAKGEDYLKYWCDIGIPFWAGQGVPIFMFVSGWLFVNWIEKKQITKISECYKLKDLCCKFLRFIVPFFIFIISKIVVLGCVYGWTIQSFTKIRSGPGFYYISLVFQIILICPLIYFLIKKYRFKALVGIFVFVTMCDVIIYFANIDDSDYKYVIFRFAFMISCGTYAGITRNEKPHIYTYIFNTFCFAVGITLLALTYYANVPMHVNSQWFKYCSIANLYPAPLLWVLTRNFNMKKQKFWSLFGQSTFNVFLCQNIWFTFTIEVLFFPELLFVQIMVDELILISIGILFWIPEHKLTQLICYQIQNFKVSKK